MESSDLASSGGNLQTLLLVEDEILIRLHIAGYLRDCGFRVIEAASSDEALIVLQEAALTVDIVLSDAEIPGQMDGFGLSRWVRAHQPGLPMILVGSPSRAVEAAADLCEAGPMLARPYEPAILLDRIRRTLSERNPPSASRNGRAGETTVSP